MGRSTGLGQGLDRCNSSQLNSLGQAAARQDQESEKRKKRAQPPGKRLNPGIREKLRAATIFYLEAVA
jgi:hypothetical protein